MEDKLKSTAQSGNIDALYALIHENPNVFKRIDEMEFVDTPLHIAASSGNTFFATQMMSLKPSFARKLNHEGLSPIHLAMRSQQIEMVIGLLSFDKDLVRVRGRDGFTVLHDAASSDGDIYLLSRFLEVCPDCIFDLNFRGQTAFHIDVEHNKFAAFIAMLEWIKKEFEGHRSQRSKILNFQDKDGNTVFHVAASNNRTEMIKLLMECTEVEKNKTNKHGATAKTLASNMESRNILNSRGFEAKTDPLRELKPETISALLVVLALVLTVTYTAFSALQAVLKRQVLKGNRC